MEYLWAFLVGGAFCAIGQLLIDLTAMTPARILVTYVVSGVVLGALGIYEPIVDFAGAGATVPLTGFGYNLAKGVRRAVTEDGLIGSLTGGLEACAGGITAAVVFALTAAVVFGRGDKTTGTVTNG
ncbi:MAG: stage V sporulation protein AE [Ruminiclostridium sp.]|nr:stage V sporulation protein AE [Ruminiclostridium sp.]HBI52777.1 stage V sporulation protein AE [Oscillospiraceae bacterium]